VAQTEFSCFFGLAFFSAPQAGTEEEEQQEQQELGRS